MRSCFTGDDVAKIHLSDVARRVGLDEKRVGAQLRKLGILPKQLRIGSVSRKGFEITRAQLDDLTERFPTPDDVEGLAGMETEPPIKRRFQKFGGIQEDNAA